MEPGEKEKKKRQIAAGKGVKSRFLFAGFKKSKLAIHDHKIKYAHLNKLQGKGEFNPVKLCLKAISYP